MKFEIENVDTDNMKELLDEYTPDMYAEEYDPEEYNPEEYNPEDIEDVLEEEKREKIIIDENTEFLLSLSILKDGIKYNIVDSININEDMLIQILKSIGYGSIGWEKHDIIEERNILD